MMSEPQVIALRGLRKRPVVDTGSAETIGRVRGMRIDPGGSAVAGILVRGGDGGVIPFDRLQAIGQDAVTVPSVSVLAADEAILPADTDAYGSRVLDEDGNDLGKLSDLHITEDGVIHQVVIDGHAHDRSLIGIGSYAVMVSRTRTAQHPEAGSGDVGIGEPDPPLERPSTSEVADDGGEDLVDGAGV
ncbi:MAG TPA: PRC-barrel domain-containing protein [Euzebya sp.]|nr:PRC-barrel domain-containing protein [Euzebya sp.]